MKGSAIGILMAVCLAWNCPANNTACKEYVLAAMPACLKDTVCSMQVHQGMYKVLLLIL